MVFFENSNWLPVTNEDHGLLALDALQTGLNLVKDLGVENFDKRAYDREMASYKKKVIAEESRIALRMKLLHQMLLVPGTYSRLLPVADHPGFFADNNSSMFNTKAIAVGLPIHPRSNVLISRPVPNIPGVPAGVTTIPPVFMEPTWYEKIPIPQCYYEASERIGGVPGLPIGYTYAPTKLVDVYTIKGIEKPKRKEPEQQHIKTIAAAPTQTGRKSNAGDKRTGFGRKSIVAAQQAPTNAEGTVEEDDVLTEPVDFSSPNSGFAFVKRRGTLRRIDVDVPEDPSSEGLPIPTGTTKVMKEESKFAGETRNNKSAAKKIPPGFLNVSMFPGFDPESANRTGQMPSAIYARDLEDESFADMTSKAMEGFTFDKNPILWPNKNPALKTVPYTTDFPLYAPVLFDIIQPGSSTLQQILCQVVGIDRDVSAVSVQQDSNSNLLSVGANFNIFIRQRNALTKWKCINLLVIDDDFRESIPISQRHRSMSSMKSFESLVISNVPGNEVNSKLGPLLGSPIPSGFSPSGDPYFPTPVNMPPMPAGYTSDMVPYYSKVASVKPQPVGVTTDGVRFYNPDGSLSEGSRNQVGGYDNVGHPFFIPKGCILPVPLGFTTDGIPYFDIPAILNQKGVMLLAVSKQARATWPTFDEEDDSITQIEFGPDGKPVQIKMDSAKLLNDLLTQLKITQAEISKTLVAGRSKTTGVVRRLKDYSNAMAELTIDEADEPTVEDPDDIVQYLKDSDEYAHLKSSSIRVQMEPTSMDFQSVHSPVTKNIVLRYRANRGDREERDFFISVEPAEVFTVPSFHLKLQGEGVSQISVTFNPIGVHSEKVEGSLSLIDETGKRLVSCDLVAMRQSFIRITPGFINAGWMLPEKRKEVFLKIENLATIPVTLTLELSSEANARAAVAQATAVLKTQGENSDTVNEMQVEEIKKKGFSIPQRALKLQPSESRLVPVVFEPYSLGRFSDGIEVSAPGGDLVRVALDGVAGIPIALYPENAENSQAGGHALTPERTEFMKKFRKNTVKEKVHTPLTDIDIAILQNMMSATASSTSRRSAHTVDFGICNQQENEVMRCVTIMNLSDSAVSIGLYPHLAAIKCKYLVKIPPRSATTVEIILHVSECTRGNISTAIEVICPEFQNTPLYVKAFVGQPLYFNTWDIVYFRPCPAGVTDQLLLNIVNESQYDIEFILNNLNSNERMKDGPSYFSSQFSDDESKYDKIHGFGAFPVSFSFTARQRGPWMKSIGFKLSKAFGGLLLPGCPSGNMLKLVGLCVQPYAHLPGSTPDKNCLEMMRLWMSHPKRVLDEYAYHDAEREKRFDLINFDGQYVQRKSAEDLELSFQKEEVVFRLQKARSEDPMAHRRTQVQTVISRNKGVEAVPAIWLASTQFNVDPRAKKLRPGAQDVTDVMFIPPPDAVENVTTGMAFGELERDDSFPIPFTFKCDASGVFESSAELHIKDAMDRSAKPIKLANVVLRANSVNTSISGFPESLEFGSTVVFHKKVKTFTITNNGTMDTMVSLSCRGPFSVSPKSVELFPKASQEFRITFCPTESRTFSSKIHVYANQRLYMISATGCAGTADLVCEMYTSKDIDFGVQREGTIAWSSFYLTNKGTFPLSLNAITATHPELIKMEYCAVTSTVPFSSSHVNKNPVTVSKNYWAIVRRKLQVYIALKSLRKTNNLVSRNSSKGLRRDSFIEEHGTLVPVSRALPDFDALHETLFPVVPELRPFYSYHFKVGYLNRYAPIKNTDVYFHYMPITTEENEESLPKLIKEMSLRVTGTVYRPLEIFPSSLDFGVSPVEIFDENAWAMSGASKNDQKEITQMPLQVMNMSLEAQNLTLDFISPEYKISGKTWSVNPGEKLLIPIEFHPPKEQTQYRGEARFQHNNETQHIVLTGKGASAEVVADDVVDFGKVKLGSVSQQNLRISNRGLLSSRYILDIVQNGNDFSFTDDEPYESEGVIVSGASELVEIECCCETMVANKAFVSLRWERIPGGSWHHLQLPLLVQTGIPIFRLNSLELDFKTTYINVNKTLEFSIANDGNASCYWALESCLSTLKVTPDTGVIPPGGVMFVEVEFAPFDFEQLAAELPFYTDAGRKSLMCYGLVGIPYMRIPPEQLDIDFGIAANVLFRAIPKHYGTTVTAKFVVSTKDGEQLQGSAKVTGGRAIIRIAPPTFEQEDGSVANRSAELSPESHQEMQNSKNTALFEMSRLAFQSHIENLQDVLSGLSSLHQKLNLGLWQLGFRQESLKHQRLLPALP
ncbi:hypothetical protein HDU98_010131 [Podochytrium sp. JEL0797]|nr:hypothetical protein HDU98_010131 [Podochytrium sp. JEL0797]